MDYLQLHDIVVFKATPNAGEMIITDIKDKYRNFPYATSENPVIFVKYWDAKKKEYNYDCFYANHLMKVDKV